MKKLAPPLFVHGLFEFLNVNLYLQAYTICTVFCMFQVMKYKVNLYPSGLVISPFCPWIAASPDRKVYNPERQPNFGLLEIKCPLADNIANVDYIRQIGLSDLQLPILQLRRSHDYYYQIMCQLAVTGLDWCDLFVYLTDDEYYLETVTFDPVFWKTAQAKIDNFYFAYYVKATAISG